MSLRLLLSVCQGLSRGLVFAGALGLLAMTLIIGWQVFGRYVLHSSPDWSEQASLTLMIWYVSLAAAAGVHEGFHIRIGALVKALGRRGRTVLMVISEAIVGLCGLAMAIWGSQLVVGTWAHVIPTLGLPRGFAYLSLPIAGLLICLFSVERIAQIITARALDDEEDPRWN